MMLTEPQPEAANSYADERIATLGTMPGKPKLVLYVKETKTTVA